MLRFSAIALVAALGFTSAALSARAEDAPEGPKHGHKEGHEGRRPMRPMAMLLEGITLSDDQKAALEKLREDGKKAHEEAKDKGEKHEKGDRKEAMAKHIAAVRAILTADQAKIFDANVKKMEEHRAAMEKKKGECKECEKKDDQKDGK